LFLTRISALNIFETSGTFDRIQRMLFVNFAKRSAKLGFREQGSVQRRDAPIDYKMLAFVMAVLGRIMISIKDLN
jgi:hypothetical protein